MLDDSEFSEGVYNSYDQDGDGDLAEDEFGDFGDDAGDQGIWDV
ncbi:hypothetical protein GCM10027040_29440 [Halomonas shantousis]